MYLLRGQLEHGGALPLHIIDGLTGGVEEQSVLPLRHGHAALRLHKAVLLPGGLILSGDHIFRFADGGVGVSPGQVSLAHHVAVRVDKRCVSPECVEGIGHRLQLGVIHLHQGGNLLQLLLFVGGHHGDDVAHIFGDVPHSHHHVPILLDVANDVVGYILLGQDSHAVRMSLGLADVDLVDPGTRIFGVDPLGVEHPFQLDVVGIDAGAVYLLFGVDASGPLVHVEGLGGSRDGLALPEELRRHEDGVLDLLVAGTAAQVAPDGLFHVRPGGVQVPVQQALGRDDHARDAEAALYRPGLGETVLIDLHLLRVDALHRQHLFPCQAAQEGDAGLGLDPVHQHGAGAAGSFAAPVLGGGEMEVVPEEPQ